MKSERATNTRRILRGTLPALLLGIAVLLAACGGESRTPASEPTPAAADTVWTCSMHPQIALPEPGDCPICGMDLILRVERGPAAGDPHIDAGMDHGNAPPTDAPGWACAMNCVPPLPEPGDCPVCGMTMVPVGGAVGAGGTALELSRDAIERASIRTSPVRRRFVERELRVPGEVAVDEGRLNQVSAWVGGRVTAVHGARVGETVRAGAPLYELYGPELLAAQRELLQPQAVAGARERLRRWGVGEAQLERVFAAGAPLETLTIDAPVGGRVLKRLVEPGRTVAAGAPLFELADLDRVWVQLEIDEGDLALVAPGTAVRLRPEGLPGQELEASVAFVDPVVDPQGRTARARVELANPQGRLRPGQFVEGRLALPIKVDGAAPLAVPASAVLRGGERDLVYVETAPGRFEPREVRLGLQGGEWRIVLHGLEAGERVVTLGAFRIDSALQIRGAASLMQPTGGGPAGGEHDHGH